MKITVSLKIFLQKTLLNQIYLKIHVTFLLVFAVLSSLISIEKIEIHFWLPMILIHLVQFILMTFSINKTSKSPFFKANRELLHRDPSNLLENAKSKIDITDISDLRDLSTQRTPKINQICPIPSSYNSELKPKTEKNSNFIPSPPSKTFRSKQKLAFFFDEKNKKIKFCIFCRFFKPRRTVHCRKCGICVSNFDHHCIWLNNCIGKNNYILFIVYIVFTISNCFLCSSIMLWVFIDQNSAKDRALSFITLIIGLSIGVICVMLLGFHIILRKKNLTTYEFLKHQEQKRRIRFKEKKIEREKLGKIENGNDDLA